MKWLEKYPSVVSAVSYATAFIHSINKPQATVDARLNSERARNIEANRHIVKCCAESLWSSEY